MKNATVETGKNRFGETVVKVWLQNEYGFIAGVGADEAKAWRQFERTYERICNGPLPVGMRPTGK